MPLDLQGKIERLELIVICIFDALPVFIKNALPKHVQILIKQIETDMKNEKI